MPVVCSFRHSPKRGDLFLFKLNSHGYFGILFSFASHFDSNCPTNLRSREQNRSQKGGKSDKQMNEQINDCKS